MRDGAVQPGEKVALADALPLAEAIAAWLAPHCTRCEIAGSIRREKEMVGDIEILYIPRVETEADAGSLFAEPVEFLPADRAIKRAIWKGRLSLREGKDGTTSYGPKNKLLLHPSGIGVDLFSTTEASWWNYLVCRTGPKESNTLIASRAQELGWQWGPYSPGFTRRGETRAMESEEAVFKFVGLPYAEPEGRAAMAAGWGN